MSGIKVATEQREIFNVKSGLLSYSVGVISPAVTLSELQNAGFPRGLSFLGIVLSRKQDIFFQSYSAQPMGQ